MTFVPKENAGYHDLEALARSCSVRLTTKLKKVQACFDLAL